MYKADFNLIPSATGLAGAALSLTIVISESGIIAVAIRPGQLAASTA